MQRVAEQRLPRHIRLLAQAHRLGPLQRIYETGRSAWVSFLLGLLCASFGALLLAAFLLYYNDTFSWWPSWQAILIPAIGTCWLLFGLWLLFTPLFSPRVRAYIFSRGLIYQKYKVEIVSWKQVAKLWKEHRLQGEKKVRRYTIQREDGKTFLLSSQLAEFELMGQFLEKVIRRRCLPIAIAAYHNGYLADRLSGVNGLNSDPLDFREITLDAQGLRAKRGKKRLCWQDFGHSVLDETALRIFTREDRLWLAIPVARLPNIGVLQSLLAYIQRDLARRSQPQIIAYNAGTQLFFGKLSISQQGITLDSLHELLPWHEIASIGVGEHEVIIRRQGPVQEWYAIPLWAISNVPALKTLLEHILLFQYT